MWLKHDPDHRMLDPWSAATKLPPQGKELLVDLFTLALLGVGFVSSISMRDAANFNCWQDTISWIGVWTSLVRSLPLGEALNFINKAPFPFQP